MSASPDAGVTLTRRDLIVFEQRLKDAIAGIFPFKGHSIVFPRTAQSQSASWLDAEKKLLLPLSDSLGTTLGIFTARGVDPLAATALLPHWPALNQLLIDNVLLYKRSLCDPVTGLYTRHYLLERMSREMDAPRGSTLVDDTAASRHSPHSTAYSSAPSGERLLAGGSDTLHRGSLGVLAIRMVTLRDVVREFGYQFADTLMAALAETLTTHCPEQALASRIGDSEFAVLLPSATPKICRALAEKLATALRAVSLEHPLRRERVGTAASVGFALYPHDMDGSLFLRPAQEQARRLLRKARLAAALAGEDMQNGVHGTISVMGFGRILAEGGRVLETLPLSRVVVSLGAGMHAREGLRFSVWSARYQGTSGSTLAPLYKGEVVLMNVGENLSHAEISHLGDPAWSIEPGDRLALLPEEQDSTTHTQDHHEVQRDPVTGFLRHSDFSAQWAQAREACESFTLALVRLAPQSPEGSEDPDIPSAAHANTDDAQADHANASAYPEQFMTQAAQLCREELGRTILGGRYGLNSLVFFHPHHDAAQTARLYEKLAPALEKRLGLTVAVGIASHPFLDFRKSDALENSRKALEYALLLPKPHVGVLDSLALNISADKRFSQGDTFGAIEEYQLALIADEGNEMAWNSLGICFAGLGRHAEAERHFAKALACCPNDPMALYNLGYVHQSQNQTDAARARYLECLAHSPEHLYALIRLGQLHENAGEMDAARSLYEKAAAKPDGESLTRRHFARLCLAENKPDEAREHLHEALIHDPQDALALHMLARLYLDAGEDPDMAASLARQSVSLRPDLKSAWLELARALDAMGQSAHAKEARLKAL